MRKLTGLIIIAACSTSCAHNKIQFSKKNNFNKHEIVQMNQLPAQGIEKNELIEVKEETTIKIENADFITVDDKNSSNAVSNLSERNSKQELQQAEPIKIQKIPTIKSDDEKELNRKANNKIAWGAFLFVLSIFLIVINCFLYAVALIWGGFTIFSLMILILFLVLGTLLLINGLKQIKKGNEMKEDIKKNSAG